MKIPPAGHDSHNSDPVGTIDTNCEACSAALNEARPNWLLLDPSDPFDKVLISMVEMNRKKRKDYAGDGNPFSNFDDSSYNLGLKGFGPTEAAYQLLLTKVARLRSLRQNGRMNSTANESVLDTWLDLAVYSVICLALVQRESEKPDGN